MTDTDRLEVLLETVAVHIGWLRSNVLREHAHKVDNNQSAGYLERLVAEVERLRTHPDMPLASPGIATASRSPNTPPDHPAGINHPGDEWTTTVAELAKFADAGGDLGEWQYLNSGGHWLPVVSGVLHSFPGRFPVRVRRRQP